jgi:hypothetical protein
MIKSNGEIRMGTMMESPTTTEFGLPKSASGQHVRTVQVSILQASRPSDTQGEASCMDSALGAVIATIDSTPTLPRDDEARAGGRMSLLSARPQAAQQA